MNTDHKWRRIQEGARPRPCPSFSCPLDASSDASRLLLSGMRLTHAHPAPMLAGLCPFNLAQRGRFLSFDFLVRSRAHHRGGDHSPTGHPAPCCLRSVVQTAGGPQ